MVTLDLSPESAALLTALSAQSDGIQQRLEAAVTATLAAHGLDTPHRVLGLTGQQLEVEPLEPPIGPMES